MIESTKCLLQGVMARLSIPLPPRPLLWALVDNLTHGAVAGGCWLLASMAAADAPPLGSGSQWLPSVLCAALSCAMDSDHFLAASSLQLNVRHGCEEARVEAGLLGMCWS